jgi:hypothetical protein
VDIDQDTFWYYQCSDGLIEIQLSALKFTGDQLIIQGFATVSEPRRSSPSPSSKSQDKPAAPEPQASGGDSGVVAQNSALGKVPAAENSDSSPNSPIASLSTANDTPLPKKMSAHEWMQKVRLIDGALVGDVHINVSKEKLYGVVGPPTKSNGPPNPFTKTGNLQWIYSDGPILVEVDWSALQQGTIAGEILMH